MQKSSKTMLPTSVRYIKNGQGGAWWPVAKEKSQLHLGWRSIPDQLISNRDMDAIEPLLRAEFPNQGAATRDINQLRTALIRPSQHIWVTVQDGFLWWSLVTDDIVINPTGETYHAGHFWLNCVAPWQNTSLKGRLLATSDLPGGLTMTAAFRSTICEPREAAAIRRTILGDIDAEAQKAADMRVAYERALQKLIQRLSAKDFELLIDLILARSGWVRSSFVGKTKEGVDIDVENIAINELAFVQVKSSASQATLLDYIERYEKRLDNYDRMIMAVHSPKGKMGVPATAKNVQLWTLELIAQHSVRLGLGDWIESRLT